MAISFSFEFVDLATPNPPPFVIEANPNYPDEETPVCILENQGTPPGPDNLITVGAPSAERCRPLATDVPLGNEGAQHCWILAA
jgi:hypothetical protein